jgi:predicted flap endonuclease-1-like 5' DNA nuclease
LSAEELLQERLIGTAELMEDSAFYNKEIVEGNLVEQKELLEIELAKLDEVPNTRGLESTKETITLSDAEESHLAEVDEMAQTALQQPGLYAPIEAAQLLADKKYEETMYNLEEFSEHRRLEALVTQELGERIPKATPEERDALQEIDGIGNFMEQQLNQMGIYTYEQISLFDDAFINILSAALDFPASVIHDKKWVEQANNRLNRP